MKIIVFDGGPRKKFNTAELIQSFIDGVKSADEEVEVKHVRLYDIDFKGCFSCMGCKVKGGKNNGRCIRRDGISEILEEAAVADGLVFSSPIYFSYITGQLVSLFERLFFPFLSYKDFSVVEHKRMPTATIYTMNAPKEYVEENYVPNIFNKIDDYVGRFFTQPERICAYNTYQVEDYSRYDLDGFPESNKAAYRAEHWEADNRKAFEAGKNMVQKILKAK